MARWTKSAETGNEAESQEERVAGQRGNVATGGIRAENWEEN